MLEPVAGAEPAVAMLAGADVFRGVPADELAALAGGATEMAFGAGEELTREGDRDDAMFIIISGRVQVTRRVRRRERVLGELGCGDAVGEVAVLAPSPQRMATVAALEPVLVLRIGGSAVRRLLDAHPDVRHRVEAAVRARLNGDVLLDAAALAKLDETQRRRLAARARHLFVRAGDVVVSEGTREEVCFILAAGTAEVRVAAGDRVVAHLAGGALIGEIALLCDEPRNATVRMTTDGELLEIDRAGLIEALRSAADARADVARLMSSRIAARRNPDVVAENPEGGEVTILKDTRRNAYYRLSELGRFVWDRLDGEHAVQELTVAAYRARGSFAPDTIAAIVDGLVRGGFAQAPRLTADVAPVARGRVWTRILRAALTVVTWVWTVDGIDPWLTRAYRRGGRMLFRRPLLLAAGCVLVAGLAGLAVDGPGSVQPFGHGLGGWIILALIPAYGLAVGLHELGHALTVKHFGRQVNRAGIGWYMWAPTVFVDTSDMWLEGRRPRILVTLAGPLVNALIGAAAALVALAIGSGAAAAIVWQFALVNVLITLINCNPMLEADGYYILMDALDRPSLRRETFAWLGGPMWREIAAGRGIRGHRLELAYGIASLAYVGAFGTLAILWMRSMLDHALASMVSRSAAQAVAWSVSLTLLAAVLLATIAQLRGTRLSRITSG